MPEEEKDLDAVEGNAEASPPEKKPSPIKKYGLIIALVILGLALAAGISLFVVTKVMGDLPGNGGGEYEESSGPRYHDAGVFIKLGDPKEGVLVNVGGPRSGKFLKASIIVEYNPGKKSVINEETHTLQPDAEVKVNDVATQFLRASKLEDFDADKQEDFKKQLKDALNAALGGGSVYDVYITSFLLQ
ncbi:MAG: flagellar basal body-associated FliL family protein [Selenomonadaceae bacterium]|nr:flagellar basal body-associated FliL family protein [Selenomonadaceae bacterium]